MCEELGIKAGFNVTKAFVNPQFVGSYATGSAIELTREAAQASCDLLIVARTNGWRQLARVAPMPVVVAAGVQIEPEGDTSRHHTSHYHTSHHHASNALDAACARVRTSQVTGEIALGGMGAERTGSAEARGAASQTCQLDVISDIGENSDDDVSIADEEECAWDVMQLRKLHQEHVYAKYKERQAKASADG